MTQTASTPLALRWEYRHVSVPKSLPRRSAGRARSGAGRPAPWHLHWFRSAGADPFSSATLYRCRCGQVRPGF
ncbi:hypothetical protein SAMN05660662_2904 [Blastococcus aurantiacus]|uniref:Uncharacterized protein n=1 Tax=Blastococcus aurantiacus TaxID=1550231 RepID=A0A1G7MUR7_9ACTN|nr:hypothetical protein SAMN05660662_2904 [Blastococcus aurantiacus]